MKPNIFSTFLIRGGLLGLILAGACQPAPRLGQSDIGRGGLPMGVGLRSAKLAGFRLAEEDASQISSHYTLTNAGQILKIDVFRGVEKSSAEALQQEGIINLEALYENALSPYPGDISREIVSGKRFKPRFFRRELHGRFHPYFLLFASERLAYGAAAADLIRYKSLLGWLYCEPGERFYKVRYFAPLSTEDRQMEKFFLSLDCH